MQQCPACGAVWPDGRTCEEAFHQMLFWENEYPANGQVHALAVLSYYIQHPSLYSPAGLAHAIDLLRKFVDDGASPQVIRQQMKVQVDSGQRSWKIKAHGQEKGAHAAGIAWELTAVDIINGGPHAYIENVRAWAASINSTLKQSHNPNS